MATIEGMSFHFKQVDPFGEDKESEEYWRTHDEGSTDFFNQYVILDDPEMGGCPSGPPERDSAGGYFGIAADGIDATGSPSTSVDAASTSHQSQFYSVSSSVDGNGNDHSTRSTISQAGALYDLPSGSDLGEQSQDFGDEQRNAPQLDQVTQLHAGSPTAGYSAGSAPRGARGDFADSDLVGLEDLPIRSVHSHRGGTGLVPPSAAFISVPSSPHRHGSVPAPVLALPLQQQPSQSLSQSLSPQLQPQHQLQQHQHQDQQQRQQPSAPSSPTKKQGRLAEMFSSIRSKTNMLRVRPHKSVANLSTATIGTVDDRRIPKQKPDPPMTPPLTGRMTPACPSQEHAYNMSFVSGNGYLDDPFEVAGHPHHATMFANHSQEAFHHQAQQQSWHQDNGFPSSSSADDVLWNPSSTAYMDTNYAHHADPQQISAVPAYTTASQAKSATLNLALHLQQQQHNNLSYQAHNHFSQQASSPEHHQAQQQHQQLQHPAAANMLLHMPQPRNPSAPILHHSGRQHLAGQHVQSQSFDALPSTTTDNTGYLAPPSAYNRPMASASSTPHRRPKPRAPSSGARYGPSLHSSPRKPPPLPLTPSAHRNRSVSSGNSSPSPTTPHFSNQRTARRTASLQSISLEQGPVLNASIRKRRSRSKSLSRPSEPRTPSPTKGGGGIGFVNFTPDDSKLLMTGVAPSGSSKTKARREKEATERQRRLSEALVKAVTAAGGDVERLKEEAGLVLPDGLGMNGSRGREEPVKMEMEW